MNNDHFQSVECNVMYSSNGAGGQGELMLTTVGVNMKRKLLAQQRNPTPTCLCRPDCN